MIIWSSICLGIIAVIALYIGRKISNPIIKLTDLIDKTAKFDLAYDDSFESLLKNNIRLLQRIKKIELSIVILNNGLLPYL